MGINRISRVLAVAALTAASCEGFVCFNDGGTGSCTSKDMRGVVADMALPAPKCAAAAGLSGDNLLCVDFNKVTQLTDPALAGWNFNANMANCWQISNGMLQVQNWATFSGSCGLTLPPIDFKLPSNLSYHRATLALVYRLDMSDIDQQAQVFIDQDNPSTRLIHELTGHLSIPVLTTTEITVNKTDLPVTLLSVYKFFLKAYSGLVRGGQGWQIQSIAVNASQ